MKIRVYHFIDDDGYNSQWLYIDNEEVLYMYDLNETPEDAVIGRDLISCEQIGELIRRCLNTYTKTPDSLVDYRYTTLNKYLPHMTIDEYMTLIAE